MDQPWMIVTILKQLLDSCDIYWQFRTANSFSQNYFTIKSDRELHWQFSRYLHLQIIFLFQDQASIDSRTTASMKTTSEVRATRRAKEPKKQDRENLIFFARYSKSSFLLVLEKFNFARSWLQQRRRWEEWERQGREQSWRKATRARLDICHKKCHKIFAHFLDKTKTSAKKGTHQTS